MTGMNPDIKDAIADLKGDLKDGFATVNARIDHLVTRAEFVAEVRRIDSEHGNLRGQHDSLRSDLSRHLDQTAEILDTVRAADDEVDKKSEARTTTLAGKIATLTRWAIGLVVTGALGIASLTIAFLQYVKNF